MVRGKAHHHRGGRPSVGGIPRFAGGERVPGAPDLPGTVAGQLARLQLGAVVRVVARDPAREVFGRVLEVQSHALTLRPLGWLRDESLTVLADVIERVEPAPLDERAFRMIASRQQAARKEEHRGT